jgi:hypothetical protein
LVGDDSGHGMLFHTFDGRLMLVLHHPFDGRLSRANFYEVEDTGDTIRLKRSLSLLETPTLNGVLAKEADLNSCGQRKDVHDRRMNRRRVGQPLLSSP